MDFRFAVGGLPYYGCCMRIFNDTEHALSYAQYLYLSFGNPESGRIAVDLAEALKLELGRFARRFPIYSDIFLFASSGGK
jgi:hypothetical protein